MKEYQLKIVEKIEAQLADDVHDIAGRIAMICLREGQFVHPSKIYGIGLSVVAELIMRERLIIKTKENL